MLTESRVATPKAENISHPGWSRGNLINVQANNLLSQPVSLILPVEAFTKWKQEEPQCGENMVRINGNSDSLIAISKRFEWGEGELSGAVGASWMSVNEGSPSTSLCRLNATFSWHSHPSGLPIFSFQDWLTFLLSDAVISCLFTQQGIGLYLKEKHSKIALCTKHLHDIWVEKRDRPNLFFLQAKRFLEDFVGLELFLDNPDVNLAR